MYWSTVVSLWLSTHTLNHGSAGSDDLGGVGEVLERAAVEAARRAVAAPAGAEVVGALLRAVGAGTAAAAGGVAAEEAPVAGVTVVEVVEDRDPARAAPPARSTDWNETAVIATAAAASSAVRRLPRRDRSVVWSCGSS